MSYTPIISRIEPAVISAAPWLVSRHALGRRRRHRFSPVRHAVRHRARGTVVEVGAVINTIVCDGQCRPLEGRRCNWRRRGRRWRRRRQGACTFFRAVGVRIGLPVRIGVLPRARSASPTGWAFTFVHSRNCVEAWGTHWPGEIRSTVARNSGAIGHWPYERANPQGAWIPVRAKRENQYNCFWTCRGVRLRSTRRAWTIRCRGDATGRDVASGGRCNA